MYKICVYAHKCISVYMYTHTYKRIHIYICIHKITAYRVVTGDLLKGLVLVMKEKGGELN